MANQFKNVLLKSKQFKNRKVYRLAFTKSNFLHVSGVLTTLEPAVFYEKCLHRQIDCDDFSYNGYVEGDLFPNSLIQQIDEKK